MRFFKRKQKTVIIKREIVYRDKVIKLQKQEIKRLQMVAARKEIVAERREEYAPKIQKQAKNALKAWWKVEKVRLDQEQPHRITPEGLIEGAGYQ